MKKIINGKVYDTSTAEKSATASSGGSYRDFTYWREALYRKKTGEYFLYGEGGPMSRYAKSCGQNEWSGGEEIIPLSYEAAQKWAEKHLDGDEYEEIFGEVAEDDSKTVVSYSIPADLVERVKREAQRRGMGISDLVAELLSAGLK